MCPGPVPSGASCQLECAASYVRTAGGAAACSAAAWSGEAPACASPCAVTLPEGAAWGDCSATLLGNGSVCSLATAAGYSLLSGALQASVNFIQKPFSPAALARKVRQVLDAPLRERV